MQALLVKRLSDQENDVKYVEKKKDQNQNAAKQI
jgi:hypothetical protein